MINLTNVCKRYGSLTALQPTNLEIPSGKVTALIGPSGCGKSTILRIIVGLVRPDSGEIRIDGARMDPESSLSLRRKLGYVIQDGGLFPHLTARQNVTLMSEHLGKPVDEVQRRVEALADLTRFPKDSLDRYPLELSGGQRQRVGLMRALALEPSTLLLDEPLGALDPLVRSGLQADLKEIFIRLGQTVVLVTHDMGEAAYLADQIVLLREGAVVQQGTLEDFQKRPAEPFVTEFLNAQRALVAL
ncbi:MAG: ATP-binding cassette domain-containing protein [Fimbriimonas sp.]|nr:ATP-binding cassette domain-containing protein [Fimbriimonas sp.]